MFAIKSRTNKYIVRAEDSLSISFNLVCQKSAASYFETENEAEIIAEEVKSNARNELKFLSTLTSNIAIDLEEESISDQFLNLHVVAV